MSNNIDYQLIGKRLKSYRREVGMTQERLAEILNYSPGYISQIERGLTRPNIDTLAMICNVLDCDISTVISQTNQTPEYMMPDFQILLEQLNPRERRSWHAMMTAYISQRNKDK